MANTVEEAIETAIKETGASREEVVDDPHELTDEELDTLQFCWEDDEPGGDSKRQHHSFRTELNGREQIPQVFATTEY